MAVLQSCDCRAGAPGVKPVFPEESLSIRGAGGGGGRFSIRGKGLKGNQE